MSIAASTHACPDTAVIVCEERMSVPENNAIGSQEQRESAVQLEHANVIVLGTHDRGDQATHPGHVRRYVVQHTPCAVFIALPAPTDSAQTTTSDTAAR
jgi:hypothetical protein